MPLPDALQAFIDMARTEISAANALSAGRLVGNVNAHLHNLNAMLEPSAEIMRSQETALNAVSELQQELAAFPFADKEKSETLRQNALAALSLFERVAGEARISTRGRNLGF